MEMARGDAQEWFREHQGAPLWEYDRWVAERYEPSVLAGNGWAPGSPIDWKLQAALDGAHEGLRAARDYELRRRRSPRAA